MYYTNTEQDIIVTETNVDTLEFLEISCKRNGKLLTLQQGVDYDVHVSGTEESWKQYVYTIPGRNFTEEGTYILTIYSEDRAENVSDNQTKGKKIEFVMDRTAPSILLSGLEDGGQYRENSRKITLDIQDNVQNVGGKSKDQWSGIHLFCIRSSETEWKNDLDGRKCKLLADHECDCL